MKKIIALFILLLGLAAAGYSLYARAGAVEEMRLMEASAGQVSDWFGQAGQKAFANSALGALPAKTPTEDDALYRYVSPEGFLFTSYSESWNEEMLVLLYEELLQNRHGSEIDTLREVVVYPQRDEFAAATHSAETEWLGIRTSFPALPKDFVLWFSRGVSVISLYDGDSCTTIESMARSLSHEYGHLYTYYYMFGDAEQEDRLGSTQYAALRGSEESGLISSLAILSEKEYYMENHHSVLIEVAAEDYVQLMGSPTTRQTADYRDIRQFADGAAQLDDLAFSTASNAWPQENLMLPLAAEVPGLADYFYSFIGQAAPQPVEERKEIKIEIDRQAVGYELVGGYQSFTHYVLTWNTPYANAVYTLVCYDAGEYTYPMPVKTVWPGEQARAVVGTATKSDDDSVTWWQDELDTGDKVFVVTALLPDGTYYLSERLAYSFN